MYFDFIFLNIKYIGFVYKANNMEYNIVGDEYFINNLHYVIYFDDELDSSSYYYITDVKIDIDKKGEDGDSVMNNKTLVKELFEQIRKEHKDSKYALYEQNGITDETKSFELFPEHNGTHYILQFERDDIIN